VRRDAVTGGIGRLPAPPPHLCPGHRVEVLPGAGRAGDVCQLLVGEGLAGERERGSLGQRVVLESRGEPGRQRAGANGPR
jgi:hypothetical protein